MAKKESEKSIYEKVTPVDQQPRQLEITKQHGKIKFSDVDAKGKLTKRKVSGSVAEKVAENQIRRTWLNPVPLRPTTDLATVRRWTDELALYTEERKVLQDAGAAGAGPARREPRVKLSLDDCNPTLVVGHSQLTAATFSTSGFCYLHSGGRANYGVSSGRWYFECRLGTPLQSELSNGERPENKHFCRIGWSLENSSLQLGEKADDVSSFGFAAMSKCVYHGGREAKVTYRGESCTSGDVVGCFLDLEEGVAYFTMNGLMCLKRRGSGGKKSAQIQLKGHSRGRRYFPHVLVRNMSCAVNFGAWPPWFSPWGCLRSFGTLEGAAATGEVAAQGEAPAVTKAGADLVAGRGSADGAATITEAGADEAADSNDEREDHEDQVDAEEEGEEGGLHPAVAGETGEAATPASPPSPHVVPQAGDGRPELLMMVGLPASGKSWWAEGFARRRAATVIGMHTLAEQLHRRDKLPPGLAEGTPSGYEKERAIYRNLCDYTEQLLIVLLRSVLPAARRGKLVLDQANVHLATRARSLAPFAGDVWRRVAVVCVREQQELTAQLKQRDGSLKEVAASEVAALCETFTLPTAEEGFDEVVFALQRESDARATLEQMQRRFPEQPGKAQPIAKTMPAAATSDEAELAPETVATSATNRASGSAASAAATSARETTASVTDNGAQGPTGDKPPLPQNVCSFCEVVVPGAGWLCHVKGKKHRTKVEQQQLLQAAAAKPGAAKPVGSAAKPGAAKPVGSAAKPGAANPVGSAAKPGAAKPVGSAVRRAEVSPVAPPEKRLKLGAGAPHGPPPQILGPAAGVTSGPPSLQVTARGSGSGEARGRAMLGALGIDQAQGMGARGMGAVLSMRWAAGMQGYRTQQQAWPQGALGTPRAGMQGPAGAQEMMSGLQAASIEGMPSSTEMHGLGGMQGMGGVQGVNEMQSMGGVSGGATEMAAGRVWEAAGGNGDAWVEVVVVWEVAGATEMHGLGGATGMQWYEACMAWEACKGATQMRGMGGMQGFMGMHGMGGVQGETEMYGLGGVQGVMEMHGLGSAQGATGMQSMGGIQGETEMHGLGGMQAATGMQGMGGMQAATGMLGMGGMQAATGMLGMGGVQGRDMQSTMGMQGLGGMQAAAGIQGLGGVQESGGTQRAAEMYKPFKAGKQESEGIQRAAKQETGGTQKAAKIYEAFKAGRLNRLGARMGE
ncbi:hypothetical protein CYMTET_28295 [Cymbomonas tetramitiformis]|uniref:B30.2/SPRY domain-containing protein n=1 Tax=Cymbomonas tetramitiformis TaxID=36881 RepID=A0AAE0FN75_9CHLO|nr:hypothetical protein CYMTET_28295 [Cymbomonas tetramitiformis]